MTKRPNRITGLASDWLVNLRESEHGFAITGNLEQSEIDDMRILFELIQQTQEALTTRLGARFSLARAHQRVAVNVQNS